MELFQNPLSLTLSRSRNILILGAGGGFDVFCGLPIYFALQNSGKNVHLANVTFSTLPAGLEFPGKITSDLVSTSEYFPELYLSQWFKTCGKEVPIYCLERAGYRQMVERLETLVIELSLDAVLLVDGGTDALMRGDEAGLGTPHEDAVSIAAVDSLQIETKLLTCVGFGVDTHHGVCHGQFLEGVAEITSSGGYLGAISLLQEMPENASIVNASIVSALQGSFGDYHATDRTSRSKLWINPLMCLYWCFNLTTVADRMHYSIALQQTSTFADVVALFERWESSRKIRPWMNIPL